MLKPGNNKDVPVKRPYVVKGTFVIQPRPRPGWPRTLKCLGLQQGLFRLDCDRRFSSSGPHERLCASCRRKIGLD